MITETEFQKASEILRSNSKDVASKFSVVCYWIEKKRLGNARSYTKEILDLLSQSQKIDLFKLLQAEISRYQGGSQYIYSYHDRPNTEDLCHFISLLQKLNEKKVKGTEAWILPDGQSYDTLLKWVDSDAQALKKLGDMYYRGSFGVPKNYDVALKCLIKAYQHNRDSNTANLIGCVYDDQKKYTEALDYFKKASDAGNCYGSFNVASSYHFGEKSIPKDLNEAERYYKKATQQITSGSVYAKAHYQYGKVYQALHKDKQSQSAHYGYHRNFLELSKEQYKIAADNNYEMAAFELACIYQIEKNDKNAELYFKKAADKEHVESQFRLWKLYKAQNRLDEAKVYLQKAASAGNTEAMYYLGCHYETQKQYKEAFTSFYKSLKKGNSLAKEKLESKKQERVASYYSLYQTLEEEGDKFDEVVDEMKPYLELQEEMGYYFINAEYLWNALDRTINSDIKEAPFQKLEFLGDGVLTTTIRESFVDKNPKGWTVGDIDKAAQSLLSNHTILPKVAKQLKLSELINLNEAEENAPITEKMQADAVEALIGAIFQDYGFSKADNSTSYYMKARTMILKFWKPYLDAALQEKPRSATQQATIHMSTTVKKAAIVTRTTSSTPTKPSATKSTGPLSPSTQRVFSAIGGSIAPDIFSKALPKMSNINRRNIGKNGDTVLMTILRNKQLRDDKEVPKIKALLAHGALWTATNNTGESADDLLKAKHPARATTFGKKT